MKAKQLKNYVTMPRIVGVLTLIIAWLVFAQKQQWHALILAIAGLALLLTKKNKGLTQWAEFLHSWKLGKTWLVISLYDTLFWAALGLISTIFGAFMKGKINTLKTILPDLSAPALLQPGVADTHIATFRAVFAGSIAALVAYLLLVILAYTIFRGLIWLTILERPPQGIYFRKFFLMNLLWVTGLLALFFVMALVIVPQIAAVLILIVWILSIHVTTILHYRFTQTRAMKKSFADAFRIGFGKFGKFSNLYCYALLVYVAISQVLRLAGADKLLLGLTLLFMLLYAGWYRLYMHSILRRVA